MEKHNIRSHGTGIKITYTPEKFAMSHHIELRGAGRAPLPVSETGCRPDFLPCGYAAEHGGAAAFLTAWLDYEAALSGWNGAQLSLKSCAAVGLTWKPSRLLSDTFGRNAVKQAHRLGRMRSPFCHS